MTNLLTQGRKEITSNFGESDFYTSMIKVLSDASSIGITPKQISKRTGYDEQSIASGLEVLRIQGKVSMIGRKLWILDQYRDIHNDPYFKGPEWYIKAFERAHSFTLKKYGGKITFSDNGSKNIHRWSPYVQGFSASFVETIFDRHDIGKGKRVLDPFVGCGTVLVSARLYGASSIGVDLMPLMAFASRVKTNWEIDIDKVKAELDRIIQLKDDAIKLQPPFLKGTNQHFNQGVLENLLRLKYTILCVNDDDIRELLLLAFASILIDVSRLKRSPALGYVKKKIVPADAPFVRFRAKVNEMIADLPYARKKREQWGPKPEVICQDAREVKYEANSIDLAVTSPPYVNGMDYIINYKIEMAWLDIVKDYLDLASLKAKMVACDNLPRRVTKDFSKHDAKFHDEWLDDIIEMVRARVEQKENYRRNDMHLIVEKYFSDVYPVFENVYEGLKSDGRFVVVIGDSLIAGTYIPADLILARLAEQIGFTVEGVEVARKRRSGQRRSFILRESVLTLAKGRVEKYRGLESYLTQP